MRYCTRCVMPDTRPGIEFDASGVCFPCLNAEKRKSVDWDVRHHQFLELCSQHSRDCRNKPYDCILPASGGKDSHFQLKKLLLAGMRPLIVTVGDWFGHTKAGERNFANLCSLADSYVFRQNSSEMRSMVREAFFAEGCPTWPIDAAIYAVPLRVAAMMGIKLIVYGENISGTYGGNDGEDVPSAKKQNDNGVVKNFDSTWWHNRGINLREMLTYPKPEIVNKLDPVYLSYFYPWSGYDNYKTATRMGFRDCAQEWPRRGCIENYDQIDSLGYMVHPWLKYPKYGHARATDVASNLIREGRMTRDEGLWLVRTHDADLDPVALDDFLSFTGISNLIFWDRIDMLYNRDIFEVDHNGNWRFKPGMGPQ
jgi:N-acetyl sugar amidotransferase